MSANKSIVLITGGTHSHTSQSISLEPCNTDKTQGNGGIGYETAAQLLADPSKHVIIGSRSTEKGEAAVKDLQARGHPGSVELLHLDMKSHESIAAAAKTVEEKYGRYVFALQYLCHDFLILTSSRLDVLINNAGVAFFPPSVPLHEQMREAFTTNSTGPALMVEAFAPLLKKSNATARILNITSDVGSITQRLDPKSPTYNIQGMHYRASKSALNMITACQAVEYGKVGMKVFAFNPGFTVSSLSPHNNEEFGAKPVAESAKAIVRIVNGDRDDEHAGFLDADGRLPW